MRRSTVLRFAEVVVRPKRHYLGHPPISKLLRRMEIDAIKRLGQHFLLDGQITGKIAGIAAGGSPTLDAVFIEVGPGPGGLTRSLLNTGVENLICIEKDKRFLPLLEDIAGESGGRLRIVIGDALEVDELSIVSETLKGKTEPETWTGPRPVHITGNLPFSVSSRLLMKWVAMTDINHLSPSATPSPFYISTMTLMFQLEVADRIAAKMGTREWSRLSINAQNVFDVELVSKIRGGSFIPPVKIDAGVVRFTPRTQKHIQGIPARQVEAVVQCMFSSKRKTIRHRLNEFGEEGLAALRESGLDGMLRAEQLGWEQWRSLCDAAIKRPSLLKQMASPHVSPTK